ncbi:hypothetical protein PR048_019042 [Dryococelus australis]|uniref:Uncharacterized protein n=1 Tax=Dryococelus australis TaxID=614101 RepID=A0ABQ9H2F1_9NEOP|nr:hypothetical protein PR048_019042 [Dryococelus australis]
MEINNGAFILAVQERTERNFSASYQLSSTTVCLESYVNCVTHPCGMIKVQVQVKGQQEPKDFDLFLMPSGGPPLFCKNWYDALALSRPVLSHSSTSLGQPPR